MGFTAVGTLLPYWLRGAVKLDVSSVAVSVNNDFPWTDAYLGLIRRCGYPDYASTPISQTNAVVWRSGCGHYVSFARLPHLAWLFAFGLLACASIILTFLAFFLLFAGLVVGVLQIRLVYKLCQFAQLVSGAFCLIACFLYALGWRGNSEVLQVCGLQSDNFHLGRCQIGWAYILTGAGGLLAVVASSIPMLFASLGTSVKGTRVRNGIGRGTVIVGAGSDISRTSHSNYMPLPDVVEENDDLGRDPLCWTPSLRADSFESPVMGTPRLCFQAGGTEETLLHAVPFSRLSYCATGSNSGGLWDSQDFNFQHQCSGRGCERLSMRSVNPTPPSAMTRRSVCIVPQSVRPTTCTSITMEENELNFGKELFHLPNGKPTDKEATNAVMATAENAEDPVDQHAVVMQPPLTRNTSKPIVKLDELVEI